MRLRGEGTAVAGEVLAGAAGAAAGFCSEIMSGRAGGGWGTRAPCHAQAVSCGGFVAGGRWQSG